RRRTSFAPKRRHQRRIDHAGIGRRLRALSAGCNNLEQGFGGRMLADTQASIEALVRARNDAVVVRKASSVVRGVKVEVGRAGQLARSRAQERNILERLYQGRRQEALVFVQQGLEALR